MRALGRVFVLVALVALAGCAVVARTNVTSFHSLPPIGSGETFTIEPGPGKDVNSLEFQDYAHQLTVRLEAYGWKAAPPELTVPTYRVVLDYGVSPPNYVERLEPAYPYGAYAGWGPYRHWPYYGGFGAYGTYVPIYERYFSRILQIQIYKTVRGTERGPMVYEGRAVNAGRSEEIAPVMPFLIRAMFRNFPGANGQTITVEEQIN